MFQTVGCTKSVVQSSAVPVSINLGHYPKDCIHYVVLVGTFLDYSSDPTKILEFQFKSFSNREGGHFWTHWTFKERQGFLQSVLTLENRAKTKKSTIK